MSNIVDFGMDPQAAIDAPRSFVDAGALWLETRLCRAWPRRWRSEGPPSCGGGRCRWAARRRS
jgi:gamma-glutamyltranspeptidase